MIRGILDFLRSRAAASPPEQRRKLLFDRAPDHIYAVGDVHGYDDTLGRLEELIVADGARRNGVKWLVMLGDYVDRGTEIICRAHPADHAASCRYPPHLPFRQS